MERLRSLILTEGRVLEGGALLVDSFLNHRVDAALIRDIGAAFAGHFRVRKYELVVTVESSGIAPAVMTALAMGLPLLICKKSASRVMNGEVSQTPVRSFTKGDTYMMTLKSSYIPDGSRVLLIDDFLASGDSAMGVRELVRLAGAELTGAGFVIEKTFQGGRIPLEDAGCDVFALARISALEPEISFTD